MILRYIILQSPERNTNKLFLNKYIYQLYLHLFNLLFMNRISSSRMSTQCLHRPNIFLPVIFSSNPVRMSIVCVCVSESVFSCLCVRVSMSVCPCPFWCVMVYPILSYLVNNLYIGSSIYTHNHTFTDRY